LAGDHEARRPEGPAHGSQGNLRRRDGAGQHRLQHAGHRGGGLDRGLSDYFDLDIGGFGADAYPKGSQLLRCRTQAEEKYHTRVPVGATVYLADSGRDVEAARIADITCIAVASGRSTASDLAAAGADLVLADLSDTPGVVAAVDQVTGAAASR